MVAPTILATIAAAGLTVTADGDRLTVRPKDRITPEVRDLIRARKAELLALLAEPPATADADDDWDERAAIAEHDAGLPRSTAETVADACHPLQHGAEPANWREWFDAEVAARIPAMGMAAAERRAWGIAMDLWHRRHGVKPTPHRCAGCGGRLDGTRVFMLPDGAPVHDGDRFLRCLGVYGRRWRSQAAAALTALGIAEPEGITADR
ncbi:hypothetical protein [Roseomonas genomospecies 6]|uniref:TubC N-terminal docking domain-containing protein n=1 Tax=Roseomonas genomospecies 6 TaxID=214106 RepID=A0A9W7TZM7_9PROT|nr:hypothetical protein [Roseomonas genomospecies 6]KAA0681860.1 hypothetical protein DS843_08785 [Roseomonas genomospecies 6]